MTSLKPALNRLCRMQLEQRHASLQSRIYIIARQHCFVVLYLKRLFSQSPCIINLTYPPPLPPLKSTYLPPAQQRLDEAVTWESAKSSRSLLSWLLISIMPGKLLICSVVVPPCRNYLKRPVRADSFLPESLEAPRSNSAFPTMATIL